MNEPQNQRIFRAVGVECVSSTELIANLIEEETLLGSVSTVSSLTHENIVLAEVTVPKLKGQGRDAGIAVGDIDMPDQSLIIAVSGTDGVNVAMDDAVLFPGDTAIVIADSGSIDEVRAVFRAL